MQRVEAYEGDYRLTYSKEMLCYSCEFVCQIRFSIIILGPTHCKVSQWAFLPRPIFEVLISPKAPAGWPTQES